MPLPNARTALLALAVASLAACGGGKDDGSAADSAATADSAAAVEGASADSAAAGTPSSAPATPASDANAPLTVADIDRWAKGMDAETKAVQEAGKQLQAARSGNDSLSAVFASTEMSTRAAGAKGAGVDEERYNVIRSQLSSIVGRMVPLESEMDVKQMPAPMLEEMKKGREAELARLTATQPADVVEALRPRAEALRKQDLALTGERLKAAGMAKP